MRSIAECHRCCGDRIGMFPRVPRNLSVTANLPKQTSVQARAAATRPRRLSGSIDWERHLWPARLSHATRQAPIVSVSTSGSRLLRQPREVYDDETSCFSTSVRRALHRGRCLRSNGTVRRLQKRSGGRHVQECSFAAGGVGEWQGARRRHLSSADHDGASDAGRRSVGKCGMLGGIREDWHRRWREVASVVSTEAIGTVAKGSAPKPSTSRVDALKEGEYLRIWMNSGGTHYIVNMPVAR